jgi:hypothetical protein
LRFFHSSSRTKSPYCFSDRTNPFPSSATRLPFSTSTLHAVTTHPAVSLPLNSDTNPSSAGAAAAAAAAGGAAGLSAGFLSSASRTQAGSDTASRAAKRGAVMSVGSERKVG